MREILFRAKRLDNGEWIYGYYVHYNDIKDNKDHCDYIVQDHNGEYFPFIQVIPETVGQYTGLKDKNGNKIFEGDIVCFETDLYRLVRYGLDFFGILSRRLDGLKNSTEMEVIGNIYDNPEILGDK